MAKRLRKSDEEIQDAVEAVVNQNLSIRSVAKSTGISKSLLADLVKKHKNCPEGNFKYIRNIGNRKTLTKDQEELLVSYLRTTSKMCHGLTTTQTRELAYQFAVANKIVTPPEWNKNNKAGIHWLHGFMSRHKELSLRQPESTSLSRTSSFNKANTTTFVSHLEKLYKKHNFAPNMIWNLDETGCMTVTKPPKVIAVRGTKQVGQIASAERGTLITVLFLSVLQGGQFPLYSYSHEFTLKTTCLKELPLAPKEWQIHLVG